LVLITPKRDWKESGALYDENFERLAEKIRHERLGNDDDVMLLIVGETGTCKSAFALHLGSLIGKENFTIDNVSIDKETFPGMLSHVKQIRHPRVAVNDEANINRRNALTKYNKNVLEVYLAIRGFNIVHLWNNPSLEILDRPFVEERINGVILITTKSKDKPRIYYYFPKAGIIKILDKYKNLKIPTLKKVRRKYAAFRGWFRDYNGDLKEAYLKKKNERMNAVVDNFFDQHGEKDEYTYKGTDIARELGMNPNTMSKRAKQLVERGIWKVGVHVKNCPLGFAYNKKAVDSMKEHLGWQAFKDWIKEHDMEKNKGASGKE
jgi:ABC-type dipeptide/oligopeptide/nickel transport system ATPase component